MGFKRPLVRLQSLGPPGRAWSQFALQALFYPKCNARVQRASFLSTLPTPSRTLYRSRRLFFLKIHRLTRTVAPPFRKRSRVALAVRSQAHSWRLRGATNLFRFFLRGNLRYLFVNPSQKNIERSRLFRC